MLINERKKPQGRTRPVKPERQRVKYFLECLELILKIAATGAVVAALYLFFFRPVWILEKMKPAAEHYAQENYDFEFDLFGLKLKRPAAALDQLAAADATNNELRQAIACLQNEDACGVDDTSSAPVLEQAEFVAEAIIVELDSISGSEISLGAAEVPIGSAWVALAGGDKTITSAQDEVRELAALGFDTDVVYTDSFFRTVAVFDSKDSALEGVETLRETKRFSDAYVRFLPNWCLDFDRATEDGIDYVSCHRQK